MKTRDIHTRITQRPLQRLARVCITLAGLITLGSLTVNAQTFSSGSTGADGALNFTGSSGTTILFDPAALGLDPERDNVYHFSTITIPTGVTVRLSADMLGTQPVVWLATGAVQISGTIDLNGSIGHATSVIAPRVPSVAGAGGFSGGVGARSGSPAIPGFGPGGGGVGVSFGGSAGHATVGANGGGGAPGGSAYGNAFLLPLLGGSGGGGGGANNVENGGGGAGGGALLIASSTSITVNGAIRANGGGGNGNGSSQTSVGGGGSGGAIRLVASSISGTGFLQAAGGSGGGGSGANGRIRVEAIQHGLTGPTSPLAAFATPPSTTLALPTDTPMLRVVRVAGQNVPANPRGSFVSPDVTIDASASVTVEVASAHVPSGTVVQLNVFSEDGVMVQTVNTTPLAGTVESSTATGQVMFPRGFSRMFIQATFAP